MKVQMSADPTQPHIRTATIDFYEKKEYLIMAWSRIHGEVTCKGYPKPLVKIEKHTGEYSVVKLAPPQIVEVRGLNVSWRVGFTAYLSPEFEVQYRSAAQSWTDGKLWRTDQSREELPEEHLFLHQRYVIRVRVKIKSLSKAIWSDWSKEYNWMSEVGQIPPTSPTPGVPEILGLDWSSFVAGLALTGFILAAVSICAVLIRCNRRKDVQKNHSFYIPDPSKFFGDLNSHHGGNFTSWLGPILARESFIKVDTEFVSPVEVVKKQDACDSHSAQRNSGVLQDRWEGTTKSSNFSNSTYFLSQSSKAPSDTLEPCSAHCSYGPAGGVSGPETVLQRSADISRGTEEKDGASELEFSVKILEKLRQDTQSPDSGFAGGSEDSMEESDLPSPLVLNLLPHLPRDLPVPHPIMHPLLGFDHKAGFLGPSCLIPGLMELDLQSPCGMIEPSSGDYMPVKNVQN
ncbi:Interleukin-2 receptor subunit beta [Anabarilius grahami]|uniref:Interleukin-2 receptor subunit beta n=1 Tax=Anabarilius grahami TaxID=495550 RepID=A0A3N0YSY1_ANAGA|nr:Interleukin-2 receptor subunit beta [Anabarilius grahami]